MNVLQKKQRLGELYDEAAALENKRNLTSSDLSRAQALLNETQRLMVEIDEDERREGFRGVEKSQRGGPMFNNGRGAGEGYSRTADTQEAIFCRVLRTADPVAMAELRSSNDTSMNIGTAADGGDLVPVGHFNEIQAKLRPQLLHPLLGVREYQGKGTTLNIPVGNEGDDGAFVATNEEAAFDRDAPAVSKVALTYVKYTKKLELSVELLQDEDSNLLNYLSSYVADGMSATLNNLLVTAALAGGTAALTLDSATAIGSSEPSELVYKLKAEYAHNPNVAWLMNRSTEGHIRSIASDSQFLFAPTPSGRPGSRAELWGLPVFTSSYMPAIAASAKSLIVGDWSRVGVRLAPGIQFLSDPYTLGHLGQVRLLYFFRAVYKTIQSEALAYATHPSA